MTLKEIVDKARRSKKNQWFYRGYILERHGPGRKDVDVFAIGKDGKRLYQASARTLNDGKNVVDLLS